MVGFPETCYTAVKFRSVFSEFPFFNYVQSKALDDVSNKKKKKTLYNSKESECLVTTCQNELSLGMSPGAHMCLVCSQVLYTSKNFVACAPTGSGKTVLFELAIIRLLMETAEPWRDVKAVYSEHAVLLGISC